LTLWEVASRKAALRCKFPRKRWDWLAFCGGDRRAVLAGEAGFYLLDLATGKLLRRLEGKHPGGCRVAVSSKGGRVLGISGDEYHPASTLTLWKLPDGEEIRTLDGVPRRGARVTAVAFSPDGKNVASGAGDGTISLWEVASGKRTARWKAKWGMAVAALAFSPDGRRLLSAQMEGVLVSSINGSIQFWEVPAGKLVRTWAGNTGAGGLAFSRDGKRALCVGNGEPARLWDASRARVISSYAGVSKNATDVVFLPGGKRAAAGRDGVAVVFDLADGKTVHTLGVRRDASEVRGGT
jgi:WD40 repeat protein